MHDLELNLLKKTQDLVVGLDMFQQHTETTSGQATDRTTSRTPHKFGNARQALSDALQQGSSSVEPASVAASETCMSLGIGSHNGCSWSRVRVEIATLSEVEPNSTIPIDAKEGMLETCYLIGCGLTSCKTPTQRLRRLLEPLFRFSW